MTTIVDVANKALVTVGIQKKISSLAQDSLEAQAISTVIYDLRDELLRMAPWSFAMKTVNLTYLTSAPGTPENTTAATTLWQPGQPTPPWCYEYQRPVDCLRACWLIPATQTGFAGGIPITTAVTGGAASFWQGPPVKFTVAQDLFYSVNAAAIVSGGSGYAVGDVLTLSGTVAGNVPIGAPAQLTVTTVSGGVITGVSVINSLYNAAVSASGTGETVGGSYFYLPTNPSSVASTTGVGTGATFTLTFNAQASQPVILTNQEFATLVYVQSVTDPNVMDLLFQRAWVNLIAANIAIIITRDKAFANMLVQIANAAIAAARTADGNEGLTINDVTPDWMRIRGIDFADPYSGPFSGMDWGGMWPTFG